MDCVAPNIGALYRIVAPVRRLFIRAPRVTFPPMRRMIQNSGMAASRVVSLLTGATEIVAALGAADRLVARSHECDYPPAVAAAPPVTAARLNATLPGDEI